MVSGEFYRDNPEGAEAEIARVLADMTEARGPRGGRYHLGPVTSTARHDDWFMDRIEVYARRQGTYIRRAEEADKRAAADLDHAIGAK
jgi:hypothetical protein